MKVQTKWFGEIEVSEDKIITFDKGIIGFEDWKKYTLVYDAEKEENISIIWLPVMKPEFVYETYDPVVEDELLKSLGDDIQDDNIRVYCALTVPQDITKMTINLKAPIIVDFDTMKGIQLIADNSEYQVRYPIYDILRRRTNMLALSRKKDEAIIINDDIEITIIEIKGDQVKLGISAPKSVPIYRKEVYAQILDSNKEAASSVDVKSLNQLFKK